MPAISPDAAGQPATEPLQHLSLPAGRLPRLEPKDADMHADTDIPASLRREALDLLLQRHSPWPLTDPAPPQRELDLVFQAALRAPDHGQLQPWRFITIRGDARIALGEVFARAARKRDPEEDGERFRNKAMAAPLLIALCARVLAPHKIPESEQVLAVGAAAMNMLNALHLLGYGGFWATGLNSYDPNVRGALGLGEADRLLGFLYVGTPKEATRAPERRAPEAFVREWTSPAIDAAR
jgi:nitroreductase